MGGLALALAGCAAAPHHPQEEQSSLIAANYAAADRLSGRAPSLHAGNVIVTTLVEVDNLERSSTLGRLVAEHVAARLVTRGVQAVEVRAAKALFVRSATGEMILSRNPRDLSPTVTAKTVVAGTYAPAGDVVYVNLRAINPADGEILGATSYALTVTPAIRSLLGGR
jgi:TolB-like protein